MVRFSAITQASVYAAKSNGRNNISSRKKLQPSSKFRIVGRCFPNLHPHPFNPKNYGVDGVAIRSLSM